MSKLSHLNDKGEAHMVDVSAKAATHRTARAEGFVAIAVANMANAIKTISVQRGHDVTRYTLACFGGAGGQHACLVADALGMDRVMIHPLAGVLSAYGMGLADRRELRERTVALSLESTTGPAELDASITALAHAAQAAMRAQGVEGALRIEASVLLRLEGTDSLIEVPHAPLAQMKAAFETAYRERFGFVGTAALMGNPAALRAAAEGDVWVAYPMSPAPGQAWVPWVFLTLAVLGTLVQMYWTGGQSGRVGKKKAKKTEG